MTGGSPSLARNLLTVTLTVPVNGSAISSHTPVSRSPTVSTRPDAASRRSRTANSFGEAQGLPGPGGGAAGRIDDEVAVDQDGRAGRRGAAAERLDPGHQLGEGERLGQVVVRADRESLDPVADRPRGGQHQHPAVAGPGGDLAADLVAGHAGQVPVQHHDVIRGPGEVVEGVLPVERDVDGHSRLPQPVGGHDRARRAAAQQ